MITNLSSTYFHDAISPSLRLSVIVPAKDESLFIKLTLDALRTQVDEHGKCIPHEIYEVLVLANNCIDETYEICRSYQEQYPSFRLYVKSVEITKSLAHIGTVRRMLMDSAHHRLMQVAGARGIIVSTDADSEVDSLWIHQILSEMDKGVDVVGGRIYPRDTPALSKVHHLRDVAYRFLKTRLESELDPCSLNPWPRHFQCFGPSLAVTCEIYDRAGRLPAIPFLEDEEFRKALKRVDAKFRHSPKVRIHTSSRLEGKVDFGFSVQLQQWKAMTLNHQEQMVESFENVSFQLEIKNEIRSLWSSIQSGDSVIPAVNTLAIRLQFEVDELFTLLNRSTYFESLWEQLEKRLVDHHPRLMKQQPISVAIQEFRMYFSTKFPSSANVKLNNQSAIAV